MVSGVKSFEDEEFCSKIVEAIDYALSVELKRMINEFDTITKNYSKNAKADLIHEQLKENFKNGGVFVKKFTSGPFYEGMFIYSNEKECSATIMTKKNLEKIKKYGGTSKYLQAFLHGENANLKPKQQQQTLFEVPENVNEIEGKFHELIENINFNSSASNHYIIAYDFMYGKLLSVTVELLTPNLEEVETWNLSQYLIHNYSTDVPTIQFTNETNSNSTADLISIKVRRDSEHHNNKPEIEKSMLNEVKNQS